MVLRLSGEFAPWTYQSLAQELGLSVSETHAALRRAAECGLYDADRRQVRVHSLMELTIHGLPYVFPARRLPRSRGIPTAYSAAPLEGQLAVDPDDRLVWPHPAGTEFGDAIEPLYGSAPDAACRNPKLYRRLALVDALRVGRARERRLAAEALGFELRA